VAPPKPPPNPPVQLPLTGWLTVTAVAVNEVAVAEPEVVVAVTQSPALTALAARVTCWVNFVVAVQVTATWPVCAFCTCRVEPETAAISPDAAGPRAAARAGELPPAEADGLAVAPG
jgi:hypothetical protein